MLDQECFPLIYCIQLGRLTPHSVICLNLYNAGTASRVNDKTSKDPKHNASPCIRAMQSKHSLVYTSTAPENMKQQINQINRYETPENQTFTKHENKTQSTRSTDDAKVNYDAQTILVVFSHATLSVCKYRSSYKLRTFNNKLQQYR